MGRKYRDYVQRLDVVITPELNNWLLEEVKELNCNRSQLVRALIKAYKEGKIKRTDLDIEV